MKWLAIALTFTLFIPTVVAQTLEQREPVAFPACIEIIKGTERRCETFSSLPTVQTAHRAARKSKCELTQVDYAVFGALLNELQGYQVLIVSVTATPGSEGQRYWAAPSPETFSDYVEKSQSTCAIKPKFGEPHSYKIIANNELDNLFHKGLDSGWEEFYKSYSKCAGFWQFSRPGYNSSRDEALLYVVHSCGALCGTGSLYLLSKQSGKWTVKNSVRLWIS